MTEQEDDKDMPKQDDLLGLGSDSAEALRLSDALALHESGVALDLDSRVDPTLHSLVHTSTAISAAFNRSTETEAFERFHHRTRTNIIAALAPPPEAVASAPGAPKPSLLQRWNSVFAAAGAAAAAAIATFIVTVAAIGNGTPVPVVTNVEPVDEPQTTVAVIELVDKPQTTVAVIEPTHEGPLVNFTALTVDKQLDLWLDTLLLVATLNADDQTVGTPLLRTLTNATASVTHHIEHDPEAISGAAVFVSHQTAFNSARELSEVTISNEADQPALDTAQLAADQAFVVAARYFEQNPDRIPSIDDVAARLDNNVINSNDAVDRDDAPEP